MILSVGERIYNGEMMIDKRRTTLNKGLFPLALSSVVVCKLQLQLLPCT